jgi:hypothetical protein
MYCCIVADLDAVGPNKNGHINNLFVLESYCEYIEIHICQFRTINKSHRPLFSKNFLLQKVQISIYRQQGPFQFFSKVGFGSGQKSLGSATLRHNKMIAPPEIYGLTTAERYCTLYRNVLLNQWSDSDPVKNHWGLQHWA